MSAWLFQGNPRTFSSDVATWQVSDLTSWCVVRYRGELIPGDDFAFWVSGRSGGVHALGTVVTPARSPADAAPADTGRALAAPRRYAVGLRVDVALFDCPVPRQILAEDDRFATAAVLRQPFAANPFPLTAVEWQAVRDHALGAAAKRPR